MGLGADVAFGEVVRLGLGYRFTDFGKSKLGQGAIDDVAMTYQLEQSHLCTNLVLAELTFSFL